MSGLGLGDYTSSDEDESAQPAPKKAEATALPTPKSSLKDSRENDPDPNAQTVSLHKAEEPVAPQPEPSVPAPNEAPQNGYAIGPALEPSIPPSGYEPPTNTSENAPQSPYTSTRLMVRDLTMPRIPNFNIPDSPPDSPPAGPTAKFAKFLELKNKGVHFNEKLQSSSALRNPGLLQKLMEFAGISHEEQYASALPDRLAVPISFPEWAYADRLNKSQEKMTKKKEAEKAQGQREAVEFVSASNSGRSTPAVGQKGTRTSAAERVMAGLDREESRSPATSDVRSKRQSPSRSPRRKKSRFDR